ncbi:Anaphase-promoting complex subunit 2 [Forsythia ovata]|uniref:Anaphase-promoting complex subunit 2 n=1 Tax=Forsythia ovata TaxID=205694 RepID=A0ABD1WIZ8_9LAMI
MAGDDYRSSVLESIKHWIHTVASTNDILHQYVSTIKSLRTIDPAGVLFLEAVGEPMKEYLRRRKDKCIVTMLTDGAGGNPCGPGSTEDSLLEELNRDEENQESFGLDDDVNTDDIQLHGLMPKLNIPSCLGFCSIADSF